MADLAFIDLLGFWIGIFLTFCILSFLYKDNPFYKFAEHLFIGVSIGYVVTKQYYDTLRPKLIVSLADHKWWYVIGLVLAIMLLLKLFRKTAHLGRYPIAFVVGLFAGLQITGVAQGDLGKQAEKAMESVVAHEVDINTATKAELQLLPGFSPVIANKVIARRAEKPFASLDELKELPDLTEMQVEDLIAARGNIAGLDAQATTLTMLPASTRLGAVSDRLEAFLKTRDSSLKKLSKVAGEAAAAEAKAKADDKKAAAKKTGEARDALEAMTRRFDEAAALRAELSKVSEAQASHPQISAYEATAERLLGSPAPSRVGAAYPFGTLSKILLLLGLLAGLIYFYFSIEQKGPVGRVSRFGVWVLMIGFGASFGYTVQGRISLAIGRVLDISGANKDPNLAAQINGVTVAVVSILIIVAGLVVWELGQRKSGDDGPSDDDDGGEPQPKKPASPAENARVKAKADAADAADTASSASSAKAADEEE